MSGWLAAASALLATAATASLAGDASAALYGVAVTIVAASAVAVPRARRVVGVLLLAFALLGAASIGLLFLPSAIAMLGAGATART